MEINMNVSKQYQILSVLLVTLSLASCAKTQSTTQSSSGVESITIHSNALENARLPINTERELIISLPPSYATNTEKHYPVVYLLHGLGGKAQGWFSDKEGEPNVEKTLARLYAENKIDEMIVVVPDSYNDNSMGGWYSNSTSGGNWEDYIIKDVIPYIDKNYRTKPEQRGLAGGSMGGYATFKYAIKYPGMFSGIYALSAAMLGDEWFAEQEYLVEINKNLQKPKDEWSPSDTTQYSLALTFTPNEQAPLYAQLPITEQSTLQFKQHSIQSLLAKNLVAFKAAAPVIKFDVGSYDYAIKKTSQALAATLEQSGINASYSEYKGGHWDKHGLIIEHELFQFFSMHFNNTLPETLPPSLLAFQDETVAITPEKIVTLSSKTFTGFEAFDADGPTLWNTLFTSTGIKPAHCNNNAFIGLARWDNNSPKSYYLTGCELLPATTLSNKGETKIVMQTVPENSYAVFAYKGTVDHRYGEMINAIYQQWLPESGYQLSGDYHFESYGEEFIPYSEDSILYFYIPIKK